MKFKIGERVRILGHPISGTVINVDPDDDEFPYEVEIVGLNHNITEIFAEDKLGEM